MTAAVASIRETAAMLGVSDDLIYELVARGVLPALELGRRKVVPLKAIDMVLDRALEGFDPDAVLVGLAGAAHSSDDEHGMRDAGEWTGTTGPTTGTPSLPSRSAPAGPSTSRLRPLRSPIT